MTWVAMSHSHKKKKLKKNQNNNRNNNNVLIHFNDGYEFNNRQLITQTQTNNNAVFRVSNANYCKDRGSLKAEGS